MSVYLHVYVLCVVLGRTIFRPTIHTRSLNPYYFRVRKILESRDPNTEKDLSFTIPTTYISPRIWKIKCYKQQGIQDSLHSSVLITNGRKQSVFLLHELSDLS